VYGLLILIPALALAGATGLSLARSRSGAQVAKKKKRMPVLALNGLLIMVPAAFFLRMKALSGEFDGIFYSVQLLELAIGIIQLVVLGLNFRDGLRITGRLKTNDPFPLGPQAESKGPQRLPGKERSLTS
jgi:hypothetical protein